MNSLEAALRRIQTELETYGVQWALVGGLAVSARSEPRFTRDADLAVAVQDDREAELLVRWLLARGYQTFATVEQEAVERLATVRLIPPGERAEGLVVDLLFASSGIEPEIAAAAEPLEILPKLTVPVARTGHLIALKVLSRDDDQRPTDLADLRALLGRAGRGEIEEAERALEQITDRGFHRGRDLRASFKDLRRSARP